MAYWVTGSLLVPFDDIIALPTKAVMTVSPHTDTREVDNFRQGVELKTVKHVYGSTQPKMMGGEPSLFGVVSHEQNVNSPGQATSFTDFYADHEFVDLSLFKVDDYMALGADYDLPLWLNGGPQYQEEAILEPLTITFRLNSIEGVDPTRTVKGSIEETDLEGNIIEQFIDTEWPTVTRPWLDFGETQFGDLMTGSVTFPGYIPSEQQLLAAFSDTTEDEVALTYVLADTATKSALLAMAYGMSGSILPSMKKSATAGWSHYGPELARYGTDSIAFSGWMRGS